MTKNMCTSLKCIACGIAVIGIIAAFSNTRYSRRFRLKRGAFKAVRGFNYIVSGIRDML